MSGAAARSGIERLDGAALVEGLFPMRVTASTGEAGGGAGDLLGVEHAAISTAGRARREEFASGRSAARQALAKLGGPRVAIGVGPMREPLWPQGYVGSLTHCRGFCAAVVAHADAAAGLGLDAELCEPLPPDVEPLVCSWRDYPTGRLGDPPWSTVIFTAKESFIKADFPLTGDIADYAKIALAFAPRRGGGGRFTAARRDRTAPRYVFRGAWRLIGAHLVTAVWALASSEVRPPCAGG